MRNATDRVSKLEKLVSSYCAPYGTGLVRKNAGTLWLVLGLDRVISLLALASHRMTQRLKSARFRATPDDERNMLRTLVRIVLVAWVLSLVAPTPSSAEWPKAGVKQPGGFCHYGYYYNPCADYGPYYRGPRCPAARFTVRKFCGVPYPGYYYGYVPGVRPGPHQPYSACIGGMPAYSKPAMYYLARSCDDSTR
jgi:hypothetical protein